MSNCKWCDKEFEAIRPDHYFCSDQCRQKHKRMFRHENTPDPDFWAVTTPYGSHGFDPIVAEWMHKLTIPGSTLCGV